MGLPLEEGDVVANGLVGVGGEELLVGREGGGEVAGAGEAGAVALQEVGVAGEERSGELVMAEFVPAPTLCSQLGGQNGVGGRVFELHDQDAVEQRDGFGAMLRVLELRGAFECRKICRAGGEGSLEGLEGRLGFSETCKGDAL